MSMPPEASGPVLAARRPMRIGPLFCARTRLGAAMLAIPAPAILETNCRRDTFMNPPGAFQPNINSSNFSLVCVIYRTDVVNDQVIITLLTPCGRFAQRDWRFSHNCL